MGKPVAIASIQQLQTQLAALVASLPDHEHGTLIHQTLQTLVSLSSQDLDRLDWKILSATLLDLQNGFQIFHPYRHTRKIAVFGSSRMPPESAAYQLALDFAQAASHQGFMVMTGAGGGIMEAANQGAGAEQSFGLNIQLPFEQGANAYIDGDPKLIDFKYFFTRKLLFLRETDAIVCFPGGFGTQDEAFECLTLIQTGKTQPVPVVLIAPPGDPYWLDWHHYVQHQLIKRGLISPHDDWLYRMTDSVESAYAEITGFYRVYHSSRYVGDRLVIRLHTPITKAAVTRLSQEFGDIILSGEIETSAPLPEEFQQDQPQPQQMEDDTGHLPRLAFRFNQRDHGRLYALIAAINTSETVTPMPIHPERK
jgi:uncharacterized protein (TIGR00730 family)